MKIHTLSCITEETLLLTHARQSDVQVPGPGQVVSDEDQSSDESGAAPAQERVEDELEHGGAPPGNLTTENTDDDDDDDIMATLALMKVQQRSTLITVIQENMDKVK